MFQPNEHEEVFELKPIGVRYRCEHCNEGEMIAVTNEPIFVDADNAPQMPMMRKHRCNKCGGVLMLPKTYPYIEWVPIELANTYITSSKEDKS